MHCVKVTSVDMYCTVLYCTVVYCTVLYCVLYSIVYYIVPGQYYYEADGDGVQTIGYSWLDCVMWWE